MLACDCLDRGTVKKLVVALTALVGLMLGARALMHATSASHALQKGTVARMDLWYTTSQRDSGAYLSVSQAVGWSEIKIDTWDWAHWV